MASALVTKARKELQRGVARAKAVRLKNKEETAQLMSGAATLAGAVAAALVDEKFPAEGEDGAELFGMPANAVVGGSVALGATLVKGVPYRREATAFGLGMASTALYQLVREKVDFDGAEG